MKKALILHGWEWTADSNWLPWLKSQLEMEWYSVVLPNLRWTEYPIIEEQLDDIINTGLKDGDLLIGHSLWCQLWMKYIEEEKLEWLQVIFVAPTYNWLGDEIWESILWDAFVSVSNYYNEPNNFRTINKLRNDYVVMLSDDDPYINSFSASEYYGQLDKMQVVNFEKKGHFNVDSWVTEFPELLKYL